MAFWFSILTYFYKMKKLLLTLQLSFCVMIVLAQDTTAVQEPTLTSKLQFYGLTIAGLIFLFLAYRQSKWAKKK